MILEGPHRSVFVPIIKPMLYYRMSYVSTMQSDWQAEYTVCYRAAHIPVQHVNVHLANSTITY